PTRISRDGPATPVAVGQLAGGATYGWRLAAIRRRGRRASWSDWRPGDPATESIERRVAEGTVLAVVFVGQLAGLHAIDHLVVIAAQLIAEILAHLAGPPRDAAGVVLIDLAIGCGVRQIVEDGVLRSHHREARDETGEIGRTAVGAGGVLGGGVGLEE